MFSQFKHSKNCKSFHHLMRANRRIQQTLLMLSKAVLQYIRFVAIAIKYSARFDYCSTLARSIFFICTCQYHVSGYNFVFICMCFKQFVNLIALLRSHAVISDDALYVDDLRDIAHLLSGL